MNKEQFLAMSLPYGLKILRPDNSTIMEMVGVIGGSIVFHEESGDTFGDKTKCNIILHPLADLTKPIEHKGEIVHVLTFLCEKYRNLNPHQLIAAIRSGIIDFNIMIDLVIFHFDVAGLVEKGEAIDVNTLPENPYK